MKSRWIIITLVIVVAMALLGAGFVFGVAAATDFTITLEDLQKDDISSTYIITNTGSVIGNVIHELYHEQYPFPFVFVDTIPPGESKTYWLETFSQLPYGFNGFAIITSDQPITGTVLCRPQDPPIADFSAGPRSAPLFHNVNFTNSSCGVYNQLLWDFGDGFTSTLTDPVHSYASPGSYTVTLEASNSNISNSNTEVKANYIEVLDIGVIINPSFSDLWGYSGSTVSHSFSLTNTSAVPHVFDLTLNGQTWPTSVPPTVGPLAPGESAPIDVIVQIPGSAADGQYDTATVTVTAQTNPDVQASAEAQTTAIWRRLFLPIVSNNP